MSDSATADAEDKASEAAAPPLFEPVRVVPTRPDGWPDWLGRRPISSVDRDRILKDLSADQEELDAVKRQDGLRLAPLFSSVTIEGFGRQGGPRKVARLRAAINAACRVAAGDRRTSYHATDERRLDDLRADRVLEEALNRGPDALHLAVVFRHVRHVNCAASVLPP